MGYEKVSSSTMELLKNNMKNNYEVIMKKNRDGNGRPVAKRIENEPKRVYDGIIVLTQIPNEFYRVRIDGMIEVTENRELKENEYRVDYSSGKVYFNPVKEGKDIKISLYYGDGIELIPTSRIYMGIDRYGEPMGTLHEVLVEATDSIDALNKVGGVIKEGDRVTNTLNSTIGNANNTNDKVNKTIGTANATNNTLNSTIKNSENHNNTLNDTIKNSEVHNNTLNSTIKNSENKNNTLNSTINTSNEKNSLLNSTIVNANATNDKVNKTIGNATTHDNALNNTITNANKTDDKLKATINNANSTDSRVKTTIDNANGINTTLNSTIKNAESKNSILNATINNSVEKDKILNNTINSANTTNDKLNKTISNSEAHNNTLNGTINNANSTNDKLNSTINNANNVDTKVKNTTETANNTNNTLNNTIKNAESKNSTLNGTIANSVEKDKTLNSTIGIANSTNDKVNGTIRTANETNNALGTSIRQFNDSNNTLKATINTANGTNDKVNGTIRTANETNDKVNSTISKAENTNNTLGATIGKAETDNKILSSTISTAETKNTALTKTVSDSNTSKANLEATINNAKSTDGTLKGTIGNANNSNTTLNNTIKDSVGKNSSLANTISQVKNNNDTLIATIERANSTNNTLNGSNNTAKATKTELDKSINEAKTVIGNTNDLLTGVQTNKKDIADLKERVVKTNNYLEVDTKGSKEFRLENTLEGKTEELKIEGRTLRNLFSGKAKDIYTPSSVRKEENGYITLLQRQYGDCIHTDTSLYKPNTKYTLIIDVKENTLDVECSLIKNDKRTVCVVDNSQPIKARETGITKHTFTTINDFSQTVGNNKWGFYFQYNQAEKEHKGNITLRFILLEGDWTNKEIPQYFEGMKSFGEAEQEGDKYKISILSHGKNLLKPPSTDMTKKQGVCDITLTKDGGFIINGINSTTGGGRHLFSDVYFYKVTKGVSYTLSCVYVGGTSTDKYSPTLFLTNIDNHSDIPASINTVSLTKKTTFVADKDMVLFCGVNVNINQSYNNYEIKVMLEESKSVTQYEAYKENKKDILIKEPLRRVGSFVDEMYEDNGQVKICRNTYKYRFTGDEPWQYGGESSGKNICLYLPKSSLTNLIPNCNFDIGFTDDKNVICNKLMVISKVNLSDVNILQNNNCVSININGINLNISSLNNYSGSSADVVKAKEWLKANPIEIIYQLSTPTTEIVENCIAVDLNTYNDLTYITCNNVITPQIACKIPKNLVTTVQETTNRVNNLEKVMYGIEGLKNFEGKGEYLEYDNTNTGFLNNCVIEGKTLENLFDINNSYVYASADSIYLDLPMCENKFIQGKVYSVRYENAIPINCSGLIIAYDSKKNYIGEKWFIPNRWETYTIPKNTSYIMFRGLRKLDGVNESIVGNGFRFTVLQGDWTNNKNTPNYFYGYGSVGEKSKNLFNGEIESGSIDTGSKREIEDPNKFRSDFITVMPNTYYTLSFKDIKGGTSLIVAEYDYNKNIIKTSTIGNQQSFLTDVRTIYVKTTGENERVENVQIEEGKKATGFENNYEGYKINLDSFSKNNLWNKSMVSLCSYNACINYYDLKDVNNIRIKYPNEVTYSYVFFNLEYLKPNTNYTLSFDAENIQGFPYVSVREVEKQYRNDANKTISYKSMECNENKNYKIAFTTGVDIGRNKIVSIGFYATRDKVTKTDCSFKNIVLAETKDYKDNLVDGKFDKKILIIKEPLRSLNSLSDKLKEIDGNYGVNRIIGEKRLDGSENWRGWKVNDKYCCFHLNLDNAEGDWAKQKYLKCNKMENDVEGAYGLQKESCALDERGLLYICIEKEKLKSPDVDGFKTWLQNNVVNILYKLRVPSIENLIGSDKPNLKVYNGSTVISTLNNKIVPTISFEIPRNLAEIVRNNTDTIKENSESAKTISSAIAKNSINIMINKNTEKVLTSKIVQTTINLNKTNTSLNSFVNQKNQEISTINKKLVELDGLLVASTTAPKNLNALWLDITA